MVRSGSRASSRKTAVASKPMKLAIANITAIPIAPELICVGDRNAVERPWAPPWTVTTASSTSTMAISARSSTPSTRLESSMCR